MLPVLGATVWTGGHLGLAFHYLPSFSGWFAFDNQMSTHIVAVTVLFVLVGVGAPTGGLF